MKGFGFMYFVWKIGFLNHFLRGLFGVVRQTRRDFSGFVVVLNPLYIGFRI